MEVYVKESLFVLDYNDNIIDTIFTSDDHRSPGYAYDINITEENTGYSDLKFSMPNTILTDNGDAIKNPKLALLTPLVKLRYKREIYYTGAKPITVREPSGYGDITTYIDKVYSNTYPDNLIENYIMDYIVQPVDKKRDVLKLTTMFTAIDYPRFNLSKKRVGLAITQDTLTKPEWTLFKNEPLDKPGTIKYQKWTSAMSNSFKVGDRTIPIEWDPENATEYPLKKDNIIKLMADVAKWPYGLLATAFYWPITSTGRFEGKLYKKGGYLVLQLYDFYKLSKEGIDPDLYIDRYSWDWTQLYEMDSYLCPNNARNYLHHILEGTNWTVAKRKDGTDDVDVVQSAIPNPAGSTTSTTLADDTCNINISGSNCYNAITSVCQGLQLYPVFDCINRTVALKVFAGKNYGLTYMLGKNLSNNTVKADGEKVITKLYVSGGKDYNGDADINIGYAERTTVKTFTGFYKTVASAPKTDVEGYWIVVDSGFKDSDFQVIKYNADMTSYTATVHDTLTKNYWAASTNRQVYFWNNTTKTWVLGTKESSGNWSGTVNGKEYIVDPITGTEAPWDPNADMYITARSPYGTNYILNLKWAYQNNWITKEQILELYQLELAINDLDYMFMDGYTKDRLKTQQDYNDAVNQYDIDQDGYESTLYAMENKYYNVDGEISKGTTYCFHKAPQGTYVKNNKHYIKMFHCYGCGVTTPIKPNGTNPGANITVCPNGECKSTDVVNNEIYIPVYDDFTFVTAESMYPFGTDKTKYDDPRYNPHLKGYFERLVMSLDKSNNNWDIGEYEKRVSMIDLIPFKEASVTLDDGYDYKLDNVYVRSTSGQIEVWNEAILNYVKYYGQMLDDLRKVNACLSRIEELKQLYDKWEKIRDDYHALIQEKFGDYLIEGNYKNSDQPYEGLLFKEGLEASDKFSIPEITYTLDVIDSSGLIEYREPTVTKYICNECNYLSYTPMSTCTKCGCKVINTYHDIYNDLVKLLHSVGQIIPKAGDYVSVYDEPMGMFGVPALITEVSRTLDKPVNNKIKLDTSYTDDEELVGNIITATNTVLSNADIYARTAVLKADGTVDDVTLKNSLDNSNADITIVGTNGNILLNSTGLRATDPVNPSNAMKYAGNGIFKTTNLGPEGEATIWEKMMSPSGINATYINAGTIDTNKITVMSGLTGKVIIDQYGLAVKDKTNKSVHVTPFDSAAAKANSSYAANWGTDNNIASFIGVDGLNQPLIYTKGYFYAKEGSNIANWITSNEGFYHLNGTKKDLWLSPGGIKPSNAGMTAILDSGDANFEIYANGNFGVTIDGKLYSKAGNIGGWTIETGKLSAVALNKDKTQSYVVGMSSSSWGGDPVFFAGGGDPWKTSGWADSVPFYVTNQGYLKATNANIKGTITTDNLTATGGSISNLTATNITATNLNATGGTFTNITVNGSSTFSGSLNGATGTFKGSLSAATGTFGGTLSAGKVTGSAISGGSIDIHKDTYYLTMGVESKHPSVSGLNCDTVIDFGSGNGIYINGNAGEVGKANTDNSITLEASEGIYFRSTLKIAERLDADGTGNYGLGKHGDPKIVTYQTNLGDRRQMVFVNGILVEEKNN